MTITGAGKHEAGPAGALVADAVADAKDGATRDVKPAVLIGALMLGLVLGSIDQTVVASALPTILSDLNGASHVAWVVTPYLLMTTLTVPVYGKVGDLIGRKDLYRLAIAIFVGGSLLSAMSRSMLQLSLFRAVQGVGGGALVVLAQSAMADHISPRERGRYAGVIAVFVGVSNTLGPLLGAFVTDHVGWRYIFTINLPFGVLALFAISKVLPQDRHRATERFDVAGAMLLSVSVSALVLITVWGGVSVKWGSPVIALLAVVTVAAFSACMVVTRRRDAAFVPLRIFPNRVVPNALTLSLVVGMVQFCASSYLPLFRRVTENVNATASSLLLIPMSMGLVVFSVVAGRILSATGKYKGLMLVGALCECIALSLLSTLGTHTPAPQLYAYMFLVGTGFGLINPCLVVATQNAVHTRDIGTSTSAIHFFRSIGGSLGVALFGSALTARLVHNIAASSLVDIQAKQVTPSFVHSLPPGPHDTLVRVYVDAGTHTFLLAVPIMIVALAITVFTESRPLRGR